MGFRSDGSGARSSGMLTEPASTAVVEVDLYDELSSFSALSPEEQRKELERVAQLQGAQPSPPAFAEEERNELEGVALAAAQPDPVVEEPASASFDFIERNDLPGLDGPELDKAREPVLNLIDEVPLEPPGLSDAPTLQPIFAFVQDSGQEISQPIEDGRFVSEPPDALGVTSPLVDILSGVSLNSETSLRCERCGATLIAEDLFCLSCGELVGEMNC